MNSHVEPVPSQTDALIVGGGIMGAGIALDLAARGLSVTLIDRGDWAGVTSSASSRLVHGGLRYLEQYDLALVRDSCLERALLLENAAGLVWPEVFHFPVFRGDRVGLLKLMAGLWLYTGLSIPRALGVPKLRSRHAMSERLPGIRRSGLHGGGSYLDAATNDARLNLAVVQTAAQHGATTRTRVELDSLRNVEQGVVAELIDHVHNERTTVHARTAILAGGPATDELRGRANLPTPHPWLAPTRGSHIVVPRERLPTDGAAIFTSPVDVRVMFLIPWPRHTIVGTTDLDADPTQQPRATATEVHYLLDSANGLCPTAKLNPDDVISTWSGLRPLLAPERKADGSPSARSREERIEIEGRVLTIAGGKLTGYRSAAEKVGAQITALLNMGQQGRKSPTRHLRLVGALGGAIPRPAWSRLHQGLPDDLDARSIAWAARYGTRAGAVRQRAARLDQELGRDASLDATTHLAELDLGLQDEAVLSLNDFLFRRTDFGLTGLPVLESAEQARLIQTLVERCAAFLNWSNARIEQEIHAVRSELCNRSAWRDEASGQGT